MDAEGFKISNAYNEDPPEEFYHESKDVALEKATARYDEIIKELKEDASLTDEDIADAIHIYPDMVEEPHVMDDWETYHQYD